MNQLNNIGIVELSKSDAYLREIGSKYSTSQYYDVSVYRESQSWRIGLTLKAFANVLDKNYHGKLFEDHITEPRVFVAMLGNKQVGWIELGYDKWNNRMRVWEFLVNEEFRRRGVGTLLMNHAAKVARQKGARMLVLETQTNNTTAINFYLKFGFELIGLDTTAYSNDDVGKKEVRLELGLKLQ
ncbi:MAG TPA: GNAT family N-acetyltransferase [Acidobacteriota bacterium]|nr:GNAT family N-acetyltransferase [Acidobacteriota bacterium]